MIPVRRMSRCCALPVSGRVARAHRRPPGYREPRGAGAVKNLLKTRRRRLIAVAAFALLMPVIASYTTFMLKPSSLPIGVRTVEWIRQNHGNWVVDRIEHVWYSLHAPKQGGPQLKSLPSVGLA